MNALEISEEKEESWEDMAVSPWSRFGDDEWRLDIRTAGRRADMSIVNWLIPFHESMNVRKCDHLQLVQSSKRFLWSLVIKPINGRRKTSASTLKSKSNTIKTIIGWMAVDGTPHFHKMDVHAIGRFRSWLMARQGRDGGPIKPHTISTYLTVLKDIYRQRSKLEDVIIQDPLPTETTFEAAGLTPDTKGTIPFIPDKTAVAILSEALRWVEGHGDTIIRAETIRLSARAKDLEKWGLRTTSRHVRKALRKAALKAPSGEDLTNAYAVRRATIDLISACYITIAGFVGMRVSEILSIESGAIDYSPISENGPNQAFIAGRLYKTVDHIDGRLERWVAPTPVVQAVMLLEKISEPFRKESGLSNLFLVKNTQYGKIAPITQQHINERINQFAKDVDLPPHEGKSWVFTSHQFRKTFARFVAKRDRSQLLGLANHFKHASVAMTTRGYVGTDFDLNQLIDHEGRAETALALDRLLACDRLAGRMGEQIVAGNTRFRGRAGEQVRKDYVKFIMSETDLDIHACDYGWCVFQKETAKCGGIVRPNQAGRAPAVCLSCANMVIEEQHESYWRDRRDRNAALLSDASKLTAAVLIEVMQQCGKVLSKIGTDDEQK